MKTKASNTTTKKPTTEKRQSKCSFIDSLLEKGGTGLRADKRLAAVRRETFV